MTDLSIIIVNYNNRAILEACLSSIYSSTHKTSFEIILSDNGSKDGSQEMIRSKFQKVKLIENGENLGFIKATNIGLRSFAGRYAMLLNDDTVVHDGAFDRMVEFMDKTRDAGACSPMLLNTDGTVQHQGGLFGKKFWKSEVPVKIGFAIGACLLVRREVVEKVGLLDEKLFFYNDDIDWCLRIRKAGYSIYFLPDARVTHYGGYSSKRVFNRRLFVEGFRGGLYFCRKHYGVISYLLYRLSLFIGMLVFIPLFCLSFPFKREKFSERLLAYFDILGLTLLGIR
ncbi:MAG TPA: glycosyltransferase family 2 protein [Candidatus Omnitrophota bacterium]|nr:glycosyltransferase family 2 protein [Candidatus Omnitrophota bacterium]